MGFLWPVYSHIKADFTILSLYGNIQVSENPYSAGIVPRKHLCSSLYLLIIFWVKFLGDCFDVVGEKLHPILQRLMEKCYKRKN